MKRVFPRKAREKSTRLGEFFYEIIRIAVIQVDPGLVVAFFVWFSFGRSTSDPSMETRQSRAAAIHLGVCDRQLVGKGGANSKDWRGVAGIEIFVAVKRHVRLSPTEDRLSLIYVTPVVCQARCYFHPTSCRRTRQDPVSPFSPSSLSLSLCLSLLLASYPWIFSRP